MIDGDACTGIAQRSGSDGVGFSMVWRWFDKVWLEKVGVEQVRPSY